MEPYGFQISLPQDDGSQASEEDPGFPLVLGGPLGGGILEGAEGWLSKEGLGIILVGDEAETEGSGLDLVPGSPGIDCCCSHGAWDMGLGGWGLWSFQGRGIGRGKEGHGSPRKQVELVLVGEKGGVWWEVSGGSLKCSDGEGFGAAPWVAAAGIAPGPNVDVPDFGRLITDEPDISSLIAALAGSNVDEGHDVSVGPA